MYENAIDTIPKKYGKYYNKKSERLKNPFKRLMKIRKTAI